ncbi:MAG: hypothetical protein HXX18_00380 [Bacteroidetes bacterium]|nr:hypothetical protein [Bacteroidota bacterium]
MKKIISIAFVVLLIVGFTSATKAQISVGANAGVAMPTGSFEQNYNMGFGGYASAAYSLNDKMSIGFNMGFYAFKGTDFPAGSKPSTRIIPIFADFKYFFNTDGFRPYVGTGVGVYMVNNTYTTLAVPEQRIGGLLLMTATPQQEHSSNVKKFGVSPTVGFWLGDGLKYGANVTYNITFSDASYIGINIGILYPLGE